jgi:putative Holliday junction resolvase
MQVLAVDFGGKRIGLAVGNTQTRVATPLKQIPALNRRHALEEIVKRINEFEVKAIAVGYPLNMDGSRGPACERVDQFIGFLSKRVALPIARIDERLSSAAAEEMGRELSANYRRRKTFLDSLAAQVILKNYFEQQ